MEENTTDTNQINGTSSSFKISKEEALNLIGVEDLKRHETFEASLQAKYEEECAKAKARAERFNIEYKPPDKIFEKEWKRNNRMRHANEIGFVVGFDLNSTEEQEKIRARQKRWGKTELYLKRKEDEEEKKKKAVRAERFGFQNDKERGTPGERLLRKMGLYPPQVYCQDHDRIDPKITTGYASVEAFKIHLFALDKEDFKAIRSGDVLKFFDGYYPRYVEWLGDKSCNIIFDDVTTAQRALEGTSDLLPPLLEVVVAEAAAVPEEEQQGGHQAKEEEEEEEKRRSRHNLSRQEEEEEGGKGSSHATTNSSYRRENLYDISTFQWRLAHKRILKSKTDVYGERGTAVRVLLRLGTSSDVLQMEKTTTTTQTHNNNNNKTIRNKKKRRNDDMEVDDGDEEEERWEGRGYIRGGRGKKKTKRHGSSTGRSHDDQELENEEEEQQQEPAAAAAADNSIEDAMHAAEEVLLPLEGGDVAADLGEDILIDYTIDESDMYT